MEQLHYQRQQQRINLARDPFRIGQRPGDAAEEAETGPVAITWGANVDDHDVAGMTINEVRQELRQVFNIAPEADVNVNGVEATGDTVLRAGDALEFVRASGEKGGA